MDFRCVRCGTCCREPGYIYLTHDDYVLLLRDVPEDRSSVLLRVVWSYQADSWLLDCPDGCPLLDAANECLVYESRPLQCRLFPEGWEKTGLKSAVECPGRKAAERKADA